MTAGLPEGLEAPRFAQAKALRIAGLSAIHAGSNAALPDQWARFAPSIGHVPGQIGRAAYGVVFPVLHERGAFGYLTGVEIAADVPLPAGFGEIALPAQRYAVFAHKGPVSAIAQSCEAIWKRWLPASPHKARGGSADFFERYGERFDPARGMGDIEIWIPIEND